MRTIFVAFLFWILIAFSAAPVAANIADLYGFGAKAASFGGAFTAIADDFSAVYYNPAGLTMQKQPLEYMRQHGFRIENGLQFVGPELYTQEPGKGKQYSNLNFFSGINFGVTLEPFDFSGFLPRKCVAFGLGILTPIEYAYWWAREYPRDPVFVFNHDYNQHMMIIPAFAVEPIKKLSIGLGINITIDSTADTYGQVVVNGKDLKPSPGGKLPFLVDISSDQNQLGQFANIKVKLAPIVGVLYRPSDGLRCGFTYRQQLYFNDKGTNDILLRIKLGPPGSTGPEIDLPIFFPSRFARYFMPDEFAWAVAFWPIKPLMVAVDVTWMKWSEYLPQITTPVSFQQFTIEPGFKDTVVPRLGLEYQIRPNMAIRGGYNFQKSPVPDEPGYLNYVDNDRHVASLGLEYAYRGFRLQAYYQYQWAVKRFFEKDPGYGPSFYAGGDIYSFGFNLSAAF